MTYLIGLDQGGTKTTALVGDETGRILGMGNSFGAVHSIHGMHRAMDAAACACKEAVSQAGLSLTQIHGIYGGVSGLDWDYERELIENAMKKVFPVQRIHVVNDCLIALRSATMAPNSAVICAGTGVNCAVRSPEGEIVFGYYIPDSLQGGAAIGLQALLKVFDAQAGVGQPTLLTGRLLNWFNVPDVETLLHWFVDRKIGQADYPKLPILVEEAALEGDAVADGIYADFARGIVPYIHAGMRRLGILQEKTDVVLSGSIFKCRAPGLMDTVRSCLLKEAPNAQIIDAEYEPVIGAYLMGLDALPGTDYEAVGNQIREQKNQYKISRGDRRQS